MKPSPRNPENLDKLLGDLPREQAGEGFTRQVLQKLTFLEEARPPRTFAWPRLAVASTALAMLLLSIGMWQVDRHQQTTRDKALLRELRAEYALIASELEQLRSADSPLPVVYLGGSEQVDFVLDLERLRKRAAGPAFLPVSNENTQLMDY